MLNGSLPAFSNKMKYLDVSENRMSGSIPTFTSNSGLIMYLGWWEGGNDQNKFTGILKVTTIQILHINYNLITKIIILNQNFSITLSECDVSNNPILGDPTVLQYSCKQDNVYSLNGTRTIESLGNEMVQSTSYLSGYIAGTKESSDISTADAYESSASTTDFIDSTYNIKATNIEFTSLIESTVKIKSTSNVQYSTKSFLTSNESTTNVDSTFFSDARYSATFPSSFLATSLRTSTHMSTVPTTNTKKSSKLSTQSSQSLEITSIQANSVDIALLAFQPITIFYVIKLVIDLLVFIMICKRLYGLKKFRKLQRVYIFSSSDYSQPSTQLQ